MRLTCSCGTAYSSIGLHAKCPNCGRGVTDITGIARGKDDWDLMLAAGDVHPSESDEFEADLRRMLGDDECMA